MKFSRKKYVGLYTEDWCFIACMILIAAIILSGLLANPTTVEINIDALRNIKFV